MIEISACINLDGCRHFHKRQWDEGTEDEGWAGWGEISKEKGSSRASREGDLLLLKTRWERSKREARRSRGLTSSCPACE